MHDHSQEPAGWYVQNDDADVQGPFPIAGMVEGAKLVRLVPETLVCHHAQTKNRCVPAESVATLAIVFPPIPIASPPFAAVNVVNRSDGIGNKHGWPFGASSARHALIYVNH